MKLKERAIEDQTKSKIVRAAVLAFSLVVHGVVFYFVLHVQIHVKIYDFDKKRTDVVLVPAPRFKFTGAPAGPAVPSTARPGLPGLAAPRKPARAMTEEELRMASEGGGGEAGRGAAPPLGGTPGTVIGEGSSGLLARQGQDQYSSRFSLVFPVDAMINLEKYAQIPEDAWLRPYRPRTKPISNFSSYLHPSVGNRDKAGGTGSLGGGGIGGGIGTAKTPPSGVVAAFVPENVKTFDLSGWASEVLNSVQRNWKIESSAGAADLSGQVTVTILVMKAGEINSVDMIVSSNVESLDNSVRRAIEQSGPWPALPAGFPDSSLEIQLVFRYGR